VTPVPIPGPAPAAGPAAHGGDFPSHSAAKSPRPWQAAILPREFFARPSDRVAPDLLGCVIAHQTADGLVAVAVTEVEAYAGEVDPASHAYRGRTRRNAVMYGPPGHAYVYFTYGMHYCVNLVCRPEGEASAVLLRAGRVIDGVALAYARRYGAVDQPEPAQQRGAGRREPAQQRGAGRREPARQRGAAEQPEPARHPGAGGQAPGLPGRRGVPREADLARGPARLCEALGITRQHDGTDVCAPGSELRVLAAPLPVPAAGISTGPRVGVSRGAEVAWRFWIAGDPTVSAYRPYVPRRGRAKPVTGPEPGSGTIPG
jgi:DNA-3-methyladenine glycosylase